MIAALDKAIESIWIIDGTRSRMIFHITEKLAHNERSYIPLSLLKTGFKIDRQMRRAKVPPSRIQGVIVRFSKCSQSHLI